MSSTRIIAIRHGETDWNASARVQGHTDIPLNPQGQSQASRLALALAQEDSLAAIYSSDLQRAHATAQAVADRTGAPLHTHRGLRERSFGEFEGRSFAQIETELPAQAHLWRVRVPDWSPPGGGESLLGMQHRVLATVDALAYPHLGQHIVLVAHGGVLDLLYRAATQQSLQAPRTWSLGNAAINRLLWTPNGMTLVGWGDDAHLQGSTPDEGSTAGH
ncbi:MAG: histidine phosphatase family protein [Betaproteobacteria bacterium]|nr:histidine phosphatase family protein [Betaproteobacteria bacterium]